MARHQLHGRCGDQEGVGVSTLLCRTLRRRRRTSKLYCSKEAFRQGAFIATSPILRASEHIIKFVTFPRFLTFLTQTKGNLICYDSVARQAKQLLPLRLPPTARRHIFVGKLRRHFSSTNSMTTASPP